MKVELQVLSQLASVAAQPAGMGYWAVLVVVEPADTEPQAGSLVAQVVDTEPQAGSLVALVADTGQLVSAVFAGGLGVFPWECSASGIVVSGPMDLGPMGLQLVY